MRVVRPTRYSAAKLRETGFRFKWGRFEDVILSCAGGPCSPVAAAGSPVGAEGL